MIALEEIVGRLNKTEIVFKDNIETCSSNEESKTEHSKWKPEKLESYTLPELNIKESLAKGARKKMQVKLSKILTFIDWVKHKRYSTGCTLIPISS